MAESISSVRQIAKVSIDISDAIRIRQKRLAEHHKCVRLLAEINEKAGFKIYEGKFDCLAIKNQIALLYEVKTLSDNLSDLENQSIKGVGQLKYYNYSIIQKQMDFTTVNEIIVYSRMPLTDMIKFCSAIEIVTVWLDRDEFKFYDEKNNQIQVFDPGIFI